MAFVAPPPLAVPEVPTGPALRQQRVMNRLPPRALAQATDAYVDPYLLTPSGVTGTLHGYTQVYHYTNRHFDEEDIAEGNKCGPAAALTGSFWTTRTKATRTDLRRFNNWFDLGPDLGPFGTSPDYIRVLLRRTGVHCLTERYGSISAKMDGIRARVRNGRPCLVLIDWRSSFAAHWAIVYAYDDDSMYLTNDVEGGRRFSDMERYFRGAIAQLSPVWVFNRITQAIPSSSGDLA